MINNLEGMIRVQELIDKLANIEKDDEYRVISVLKEGEYGSTEQVISFKGPTTNIYIRKYFPESSSYKNGEFQLLSELTHPFLPKVIEQYQLSGQHVMIEEYVDGIRLSELGHRFETRTVMEIILQLCNVIHYLHQLREPIIHRDVKPENIIYTASGKIKLIDFGIARTFKEDVVSDTIHFGTPGYSPPEQFGYGQTDQRSDIYAAGMTMYYLLTGKAPGVGGHKSVLATPLPTDIKAILAKAIAIDPEARYSQISELADALKALLIDQNSTSNPDTRIKDHQPVSSRNQPQKVIDNTLYPKHCPITRKAKRWWMFLHFFIGFALLTIIYDGLFVDGDYTKADEWLTLVTDLIVFISALIPGYVLGFNLWDIRHRIHFLQTRQKLKIGLIIFVIFMIGGFLTSFIYEFHSPAYKDMFPY